MSNKEELKEELKKVLDARRKRNFKRLGESELARWKLVDQLLNKKGFSDEPSNRGRLLAQIIDTTIEEIRPPGQVDLDATPWHNHLILKDYYLRDRRREDICKDLNVSQSSFYNYHRKAVAVLWERLWEDEQRARNKGSQPADNPLPPRIYSHLIGRDSLVAEIIERLCDGPLMVGIDGMGGIGKTALAYEVSDQCLKNRAFEVAVWCSASSSELISGIGRASGTLTFESVLVSIGQQLGVSDVAKLELAEKKARVQALLRQQRTLVVLDNLETAGEPQNEIVRQLQLLLASTGSKALLTSRDRFTSDVYHIHLEGLDENSVRPLILQIAEEKGLHHVATAQLEAEEVAQMAQATGGSPLALRLVVSLLDHFPLQIVLEQLRQVQPICYNTDEDDYMRFYKFIFFRSWKLLTEESKHVLISMGCFVPGIGGDFKAVMKISCLPNDPNDLLFIRSINQLWRLSFLEIGHVPNLKEKRYYLHALTHHFVLADIVKAL